jgi:hypothetical protein
MLRTCNRHLYIVVCSIRSPLIKYHIFPTLCYAWRISTWITLIDQIKLVQGDQQIITHGTIDIHVTTFLSLMLAAPSWLWVDLWMDTEKASIVHNLGLLSAWRKEARSAPDAFCCAEQVWSTSILGRTRQKTLEFIGRLTLLYAFGNSYWYLILTGHLCLSCINEQHKNRLTTTPSWSDLVAPCPGRCSKRSATCRYYPTALPVLI